MQNKPLDIQRLLHINTMLFLLEGTPQSPQEVIAFKALRRAMLGRCHDDAALDARCGFTEDEADKLRKYMAELEHKLVFAPWDNDKIDDGYRVYISNGNLNVEKRT